MKLDDLVKVNPDHAVRLIKVLFDPDDYITVSGKKSERIIGQNILTQAGTAAEIISGMNEETLFSMCTEPEKMDIYFGLSPISRETYRGMNKRTKEEDVSKVCTLYADLDVKAGSFSSMNEAWTFLVNLDHTPNVIVSSGSGGLHAYWRLEESVDTAHGKTLLVRWWAYLVDKACGLKIDKLVDVTRMSRLPGSIRWPKEGSQERPAPVELLWATRLGSVPTSEVMRLSERPWEALEKRRKETRDKELSAQNFNVTLGGNGKGIWSERLAVASIETWVAENLPWESVLAPKGWTFLRTDNDGRDEWARPGQGGKSATVNWPESPHVMSLLSTSEETGLFDLVDAGIALTKWRVVLRLWFNDDMEKAVDWVLKARGIRE